MYGFQSPDVSWKHNPQPLLENQKARITFDTIVPASRHVVKPDIIVMDKCSRIGYIIDLCVPNDYGMRRQEREKVVKYQDLINDMADTCNLQPVDIIPVALVAMGLMKTNLQKYLQLIPDKVTSLELQIEVLRETVSMLKRALGCRLAT